MPLIRALLASAMGVGLGLTATTIAPAPASAAIFVDDVPTTGWYVNGRVLATEIVGDTVYVAGTFSAAISPTGTSVTRRNVAAFSMTTGALLTGWRADAGSSVTSLAVDGDALYLGGHFGRVNGILRTRLAKVSLSTGAVDPTFVASADAGVRALAVKSGSLFVGGAFLNVNGVPRNRLAKVSTTTGALDGGFNAAASGAVFGLVADPVRDVLYAVGSFAQLNGITRTGMGAVTTTTGATTGPAYASSVRPTLAIDIDDYGERLFVGTATGANQTAAYNVLNGARLWRVVADGDVQAVEHFRGTTYASFHDGYQGTSSTKLLAIDSATGVVDPDFRPEFSDFWGGFAIDASELGVVVGGQFTRIGGVLTSNFARFPVIAPPPPTPPPPPPMPRTVQLTDASTQWRYWDQGNLPAGWQAEGYDDSAWPSGRPQLGYGDGDETTVIGFGPSSANKYITSYFRTTFTSEDVPDAARLSLLADDGAVVFLNGVELLRDNMPTGTITGDTRAPSGRSGAAENAYRDFTIDPALIRPGLNSIAVEVHQDRPGSSDLGMDARLAVDFPAP